jgi:hypothetical protein
MVRWNELPNDEPRRAQPSESLPNRSLIGVARLGDRVVVRRVGAWFLREQEEGNAEIEMTEAKARNVSEPEKEKGESLVVRACWREYVDGVGLAGDRYPIIL